MTENYTLKTNKDLKPKKSTVEMILSYSKSYKVVKVEGRYIGINVN